MPFAPVSKVRTSRAPRRRACGAHHRRHAQRRLSRELSREFDQGQIDKGLKVWETADILPLGAFASGSTRTPSTRTSRPGCRSSSRPRRSRRSGKRRSARASGARRCSPCRRRRPTAAAPGSSRTPGASTARSARSRQRRPKAFAEWSREYASAARWKSNTDAARLADVVAPLLKESALRKPKLLVLYAFDARDAAGAGVRRRVRKAGHRSPQLRAAGRARCSALRSPAREELEAAAQWARARLEAGRRASDSAAGRCQRVARRRRWARSSASASWCPSSASAARRSCASSRARCIPRTTCRAKSARRCLSTSPRRAARGLSARARRAFHPGARRGRDPFEQASRLVRSPFLEAAAAEMAKRARARCRSAEGRARARDARQARRPGRRRAGAAAGSRPCSSCVAVAKRAAASARRTTGAGTSPRSSAPWDFRASAGSTPTNSRRRRNSTRRSPSSRSSSAWRRRCPSAARSASCGAFAPTRSSSPRSPDAPIQVLGVLESAGLEFDALWVSGLTDDVWPMHARPNPFIPPALQRRRGFPKRRRKRRWSAASGSRTDGSRRRAR